MNRIIDIICEDAFGIEFYNEQMIEQLISEVNRIYGKFKILDKSDKFEIIRTVENYLRDNVSLRMKYFDDYERKCNEIKKEELKYRTAYSALILKETTCYGYCEAVRILLSIYGIDSKTILAKLPGEKYRIMHYTTIVEDKNNCIVVDPERKLYCLCKDKNYEEYMNNVIYAPINKKWIKNKLCNCGVGLLAHDFLDDEIIINDLKVKTL